MKTRITELFGIEHPIIQGGMHFVGFAEMAAAVSEAGGLGIITGLTQPTPEALANEIRRCREMTRRPFGVNLTFLPSVTPRDYPGYVRAIIEGGVKIVETAGNNPQKWLPALKEAGIKVIHKCTSVRHSLKAESIGCDAVSVDGFECGGHPGEDDVPNFILLPRAAEELKIPFVASGGMADGRSLVAALSLGADGVLLGTRFLASAESPLHANFKQAILDSDGHDTLLSEIPDLAAGLVWPGAMSRSRRNRFIERWAGREWALRQGRAEAHAALQAARRNGDADEAVLSMGQDAGLIHDILPAGEIVARIAQQAERILRERLPRFQRN